MPKDNEQWLGLLKNMRPTYPTQLLVLGGGSIAGKSVFAERMGVPSSINTQLPKFNLKENIARGFMYITPDFIRELYPKSFPGKGRHPEENNPDDLYYAIRDRMMLQCLTEGISVFLDDHCDSVKRTEELMKEVRKVMPPVETGLIGYFPAKETRNLLKDKADKARKKPLLEEREGRMRMLGRMMMSNIHFRQSFHEHVRLFLILRFLCRIFGMGVKKIK